MLARNHLLDTSETYTRTDKGGYRKKEYRIFQGERVELDKATSKFCRRKYELQCTDCEFSRPVPMHPNHATKDVVVMVYCANCETVTKSARNMANINE